MVLPLKSRGSDALTSRPFGASLVGPGHRLQLLDEAGLVVPLLPLGPCLKGDASCDKRR